MGKQYAVEFKESILKRILPPNNGYIPDISRETGIPVDTLYTWRTKYRSRIPEPGNGKEHESSSLSAEEKMFILFETMALNEVERGEYCRRKGLYPEQIEAWKKAILEGLSSPSERASRGTVSQQAKTIRHLESELRRKEKALAEAATLLMLKKNWTLFWRRPRPEDRPELSPGNNGPRGRRASKRGPAFRPLPSSGPVSPNGAALPVRASRARGRGWAEGRPSEEGSGQPAHSRRGRGDCVHAQPAAFRLPLSGPDCSHAGR